MHHECEYCGKTYSKKFFFSRHVILCEYANKTKQQRKNENEEYEFSNPEDAKITLKTLYNIVLELAYQNNKLEKKIEDIQNHLNVKKRKLNICKWLQEKQNIQNNYIPSFKTWIKTIQATEEEVELLQKENMYQTICAVFDKNIANQKEDQECCIQCFSQKTSVFFIFTETSDTPAWKRMGTEDFLLLLKYIHQKILKAMCEWFKKKNDMMSEQETILYNEAVNKLMRADFQKETALVSKLRSYLYNKIKTNIPTFE
jgi:hypothetical protein